MSTDVTIKSAPQAVNINVTDRIPVSQGDDLPKTITVQQILDRWVSAIAPAARAAWMGIWFGTQGEYDVLDAGLKITRTQWLAGGVGYFEFHVSPNPIFSAALVSASVLSVLASVVAVTVAGQSPGSVVVTASALSAVGTLAATGVVGVAGVAADGTDNFNRADGPLGANWSNVAGKAQPTISANAITATADNGAVFDAFIPGNNQYAMLGNIDFAGGPAAYGGCLVRYNFATDTGYQGYIYNLSGTLTIDLYQIVAGAFTKLGTASGSGVTGLRVNAIGTTISIDAFSGVWNNNVISVVNSVSSVGKAGVVVGNLGRADDFMCGNL